MCLRAALTGEAGCVRAVFRGAKHQCWFGASDEGSRMQHCPKVKISEVAEVISFQSQKRIKDHTPSENEDMCCQQYPPESYSKKLLANK